MLYVSVFHEPRLTPASVGFSQHLLSVPEIFPLSHRLHIPGLLRVALHMCTHTYVHMRVRAPTHTLMHVCMEGDRQQVARHMDCLRRRGQD